MGSADYRFRTAWRVAGTPAEVAAILGDPEMLPRWWPAVYLSAEPLPGPPDRSASAALPTRLHIKGWLPKPVFAANHHRAMARGQESLALELRRRRPGKDPDAVPPPTFRALGQHPKPRAR